MRERLQERLGERLFVWEAGGDAGRKRLRESSWGRLSFVRVSKTELCRIELGNTELCETELCKTELCKTE